MSHTGYQDRGHGTTVEGQGDAGWGIGTYRTEKRRAHLLKPNGSEPAVMVRRIARPSLAVRERGMVYTRAKGWQ